MRKVKAQPVRTDKRSLLRHMIAKHKPKRFMKKVRCRMIGAKPQTARHVNLQPNLLPLGKRARDQFDMMDKQTRRGFLGIGDAGGAFVPANRANITNLTTRFAIKLGFD
jgi:hypothetical protein